MVDTKFDRKKVIEEMKNLKAKRIDELRSNMAEQGENQIDEVALESLIKVKYLDQIEIINENGETVKKDLFLLEEPNGPIKYKYYLEGQELIAVQRTEEDEIILTSNFSTKEEKEQKKLKKDVKEKDKEDAKTIEDLEQEEKTEETEKKTEDTSKTDEQRENEDEEPQQLPGMEEDGPQLTRAQVNSMKGPKTSLNQIVDEQSLRNIIGLEGEFMQIVDADTAKKYIPDLQIPSSQRTVPIEIFPDGTANVIGEDKLQFSQTEGMNSSKEHVTATNEGTVRNEKNLETFNITSRGGMDTIAVGYDENGGMPLEVKYGWRNVEDPTKIAYSELETVHEGPLQQHDDTTQYQQDASEGIYKGQESMEDAIETYAKAMNIRKIDEHGFPTPEYDLDAAQRQLEERWSKDPDASLEELIDEDQKTIGPNEDPRGNN